MEIFGVGGLELVAILIIMLVVAGPKRMIQWSYTLGRYMSVLRRMWSETAAALQKELDAAGVDVQVPKDIPTRQNLRTEVARMATPLTKPFQEGMNSVKTELDEVKQSVNVPRTNLMPSTQVPPKNKPVTPVENGRPAVQSENGSGTTTPPPSDTPSAPDFGTWSKGE
jgi:Sec-independent protein translocase protein TatA